MTFSVDMTEIDWVHQSKNLEKISVDIEFSINTKFENSAPLYSPFLCRKKFKNLEYKNEDTHRYVYLHDIGNDEEIKDLIKYYEGIFSAAKKLGIPRDQISDHYFWMKMNFYDEESNEWYVEFSWNEKLSNILSIIDNLMKLNDGEMWGDLDQHWAADVYLKDQTFYIKYYDFDEGNIHCIINCEKERLLSCLKVTRSKLEYVMNSIEKKLGKDNFKIFVQRYLDKEIN